MSTELTKTKTAVPANVDFGDDAGQGFENQTAADIAIPFINQLQALSPEVKKGGESYIKGAEEGMFLNTATREVTDVVYFIPVYAETRYNHWKLRKLGGGLLETFDSVNHPTIMEAKAKAAKTEKKNKWLVYEGGKPVSEIVETRYFFALLLDENGEITGPAMIPFWSSKIKAYKNFRYRLDNAAGKFKNRAPMYAFKVAMGSTDDSFADGDCKVPELTFFTNDDAMASLNPPKVDGNENPTYTAARNFYEAVASSDVKVDLTQQEGTGPINADVDDSEEF